MSTQLTIVSAAPELSTVLNLLWAVVAMAHNSSSTAPSPPAHISSTASAVHITEFQSTAPIFESREKNKVSTRLQWDAIIYWAAPQCRGLPDRLCHHQPLRLSFMLQERQLYWTKYWHMSVWPTQVMTLLGLADVSESLCVGVTLLWLLLISLKPLCSD